MWTPAPPRSNTGKVPVNTEQKLGATHRHRTGHIAERTTSNEKKPANHRRTKKRRTPPPAHPGWGSANAASVVNLAADLF